jgi:hypothetical protein
MPVFCDNLHRNGIHYTPSAYDYSKTLSIEWENNEALTEEQLIILSELLFKHCRKLNLSLHP